MQLTINEQNDTATLECSVVDMQKVVCLLAYVKGGTFEPILGDTKLWNTPLEIETCMDVLKQTVDCVDICTDGNIQVLCAFEEVV